MSFLPLIVYQILEMLSILLVYRSNPKPKIGKAQPNWDFKLLKMTTVVTVENITPTTD